MRRQVGIMYIFTGVVIEHGGLGKWTFEAAKTANAISKLQEGSLKRHYMEKFKANVDFCHAYSYWEREVLPKWGSQQ